MLMTYFRITQEINVNYKNLPFSVIYNQYFRLQLCRPESAWATVNMLRQLNMIQQFVFFNGVDDCFSSTLLNKSVKHLKASPRTWRCPYPLRCRAMLRLFDLRSSAARAVRSPALCSQTCRWDGPERSHPRSRSPEDERRVWSREVFSCSFSYSSKNYYFVCVQAELFHHGQRLSSKRLVDLK